MKKVPCGYEDCKYRRKHWCEPDMPRGTIFVEVEDDHEGKAYCSLTCAIEDGRLKYEEPTEEEMTELRKSRFWRKDRDR